MRTLSAALTAEQKKPGAVPYVEVKLVPDPLGILHNLWTRWYTGTEEDGVHDAAWNGTSKSLHRIHIDPEGTATLRYSRVLTPTAASDFDNWSSLTTATFRKACAVAAAGDVLIRIYTDNADPPQGLVWQQSADDGDNWAAAAYAITSLTNITHLAIAVQSEDNAVALFADDGEVYAARLDAGTWETPIQLSSLNPGSITGVALAVAGDYHCVITGTDSDGNATVWTVIFGNGVSQGEDTFSTALVVETASSGSNVAYTYPSFQYVDTARMWFVEAFSGSVTHNLPAETWFPNGETFEAGSWKEPRPFNHPTAYGIKHLLWSDGTDSGAMLATPSGVWFAPLYSGSDDIDISAGVLSLSVRAQLDSGGCTITLRNDDGRYNGVPNTAYPFFDTGFGIEISPGYKVNGVAEVPASKLDFAIDNWEHKTRGGRSVVILQGIGPWERLARWRARRQFQWDNGGESAASIISAITGRVPIELTSGGTSSHATSVKPAFTINTGTDGRTAVLQLLSRVADSIRPEFGYLDMKEFTPSDSSDATYGVAGELPVLSGDFANGRMPWNRARVHGASDLFDEAFDYADIATNQEEARTVIDLNMTTAALVTARAVIELRNATQRRIRGEIVSRIHAGIQLWDVVTITDAQAGISAAGYRVLGADWRYQREKKPVYEQTLLLGDL